MEHKIKLTRNLSLINKLNKLFEVGAATRNPRHFLPGPDEKKVIPDTKFAKWLNDNTKDNPFKTYPDEEILVVSILL